MDAITTGSDSDLGVSVEEIAAFYDLHWPRKMALGLPAMYGRAKELLLG